MLPEPHPNAAANTDHLTETTLLDVLRKETLVREEDLQRVQELHKNRTGSLGVLLVRLGLLSETDMARIQCQICDCPMLDEAQIPDTPAK